MDRTVLYRELVRVALDGPGNEPYAVPAPSLEEADAFTKETNNISADLARLQASLQQVRPRYLAVSGREQMRDADRDDLDFRVRRLLQQEQRRVRALEQREQVRFEQSRARGLKAWLSHPDADGVSETLAKHRKGMCFYLNFQLQRASAALGELQQVRSARSGPRRAQPPLDRASPQPALNLSAQQGPRLEFAQSQDAPPDPSSGDLEPSFSDAHALLLQEEHDELLEELNATLEKAQRAEQSLREVAELQSELSQHLSTQSQQLDSLTDDVFRTSSDVSSANEQLERAKRSNRRASRIVIVSSLATGVFLLLLNGR